MERNRDEFDELIKDIRNSGDFNISSDLIIKSILVIYLSRYKNRVKNFDQELLRKVIKEWDRIKIVIANVFQMFYKMGFNSQTFPRIKCCTPIIYFVYKHEIET